MRNKLFFIYAGFKKLITMIIYSAIDEQLIRTLFFQNVYSIQ